HRTPVGGGADPTGDRAAGGWAAPPYRALGTPRAVDTHSRWACAPATLLRAAHGAGGRRGAAWRAFRRDHRVYPDAGAGGCAPHHGAAAAQAARACGDAAAH